MPFQVIRRSQVAALGDYPKPHDALDAARLVTAGNYHRPPGTIATTLDKKWRVDAQKPSQTHANIQIQLNGINPPSTAACAIVPIKLYDELQNASPIRKPHMAAELTKAINAALHHSAKSWLKIGHEYKIYVYEVTGNFTS